MLMLGRSDGAAPCTGLVTGALLLPLFFGTNGALVLARLLQLPAAGAGWILVSSVLFGFRQHVSILIKESAVCLVAPSPSPTGESPNPYSIELLCRHCSSVFTPPIWRGDESKYAHKSGANLQTRHLMVR